MEDEPKAADDGNAAEGRAAAEEGNVAPLGVEEYVEQAHFFATLAERIAENAPTQEVLASIREEVLATTKLPMAIDYLLAELRHLGVMATAMRKLSHYFTPLQAYIVAEGEDDLGRFDLRLGLAALAAEARYRAGLIEGPTGEPTLQGLFFYQFEVLCRNRLGYDRGLAAIASDPSYPPRWRDWILATRHQVGIIDFADLVYVQSEHARLRGGRGDGPTLFGDREGRIALANRRKDPLYLFNSLHRQLGYPAPPRPQRSVAQESLVPQMARRLEQLEKRIKLLEEEQRGGFDLTQFYEKPPG
ncbi:hypothetical protein [Botrimarina sp.]|uniref:hypothetical protein n=1 Tax=Botrimarina sp. TaxID=2795802 RepID=UPI0032EE55B7